MKKMVTQGLLAGLLSVSLYAETMSDRVDRLEEEMKSVYLETPMGTAGAKFGQGSPAPYDTTWFFTGEVLYWHAKEGGTEYAIALDSAVYPISASMKDVDFEWDLGFRVGVGRFIGKRNWDISLTYTQFYTSDTESTHELNDSIVWIDGTVGESGGICRAKFDAVIDYDSLDLLFAQSLFISQKTSFHPKFGLKAIWMDQKFKLQGNDRLTYAPLFVSGSVFHRLHTKSNIFGLGPKFGTDVTCFIGDGFRLFGDLSASLFYVSADASFKNRIVVLPDGEGETVAQISLKGDKHLFCPQVAFLAGLAWGTNFHVKGRDQYFEIGMGYEVQYFWRVNQTINISNAYPPLTAVGPVKVDYKRTSEDISFYGITFKARLDF